MELDARSSQLLRELLTNPGIKNKDLEHKYSLSRRQVEYSLSKINDWLKANYLPEIKRSRTGQFLIGKALFTALSMDRERNTKGNYNLSAEERANLIILMMLSKNEELSLFHFTHALGVSKNTILRDLKNAQDAISPLHLEIKYSRMHGYYIEGNEFNQRQALIDIVHKTLETYGGENWLRELAGAAPSQVAALRRKIEAVESKLNLKFTDEKLESMPYILLLLLRRVKQGRVVEGFHIHYDELSDTKEYRAVEELLSELEPIPMEERMFITLHLLTTNISSTDYLSDDTLPELNRALSEMLSQFERNACVTLQDKEQLHNKILLHLKPAYYRIKYRLSITNPLQESVSKEFKELHHLVKKSCGPLVELIGAEIPESETTYLTMLIGGWCTRQGDSIRQKIRALVVCPKGVCVSRLLESTLRELFPEFVFFDALSVREFHNYALEYDVVFSTVYLPTDKKLFLIKTFLGKEDRYRLRKQVMEELHGYVPSEFNMDRIMEIIGKYAVIQNSQSLLLELRQYLMPEREPRNNPFTAPEMPDLSDLIVPDTITLARCAKSWEEAVRMAAEPLLRRGSITAGYVQAMLEASESRDPYIIIGHQVAIPHADPECGVHEVSMSLLRLEEPVCYAEGYMIHVIVVIAAKDKYRHLRSLNQLMKLAGNQEEVMALIEADTPEKIHEIAAAFSIDEERGIVHEYRMA
ncbi:BglG family transcription antiterminator [Paenibacillus sp. p3-SID1389]|uniref:BglG family transcription antiterminator n=1 Tax=Paenibacillus sp. p3-SID1389 TaxID=2916364 RepID=UPI0021A41E39|nr:BglG family transcription antiterminator [Paenibacillus sp. p3-SID1389]MCT2196140.1 BglG family transcription antiterminator [Paenibacillus sp. p3-SID1389]